MCAYYNCTGCAKNLVSTLEKINSTPMDDMTQKDKEAEEKSRTAQEGAVEAAGAHKDAAAEHEKLAKEETEKSK
jgi:hypothetical protein